MRRERRGVGVVVVGGWGAGLGRLVCERVWWGREGVVGKGRVGWSGGE